MITNPIIPIWLMSIICLILILFIIFDKPLKEKISNKLNKEKTNRQKQLLKQHTVSSIVKTAIVITIFVINLRPMIPNGESTEMNFDLNVLFVVDTSVSMRALDYNGNKERIEGIINDCCYITEKLSGAKFSIITFGDTAQRIIPFTTDSDMVQAELKAIVLEDDFYAKGSSMNLSKEILEKTLKDEAKKQGNNTENVVFFVSDGEITKEEEKLDSFANIRQYISNGAVLGYGTTSGGKMISKAFEDEPSSEYYYLYYYDDNYNTVTALSKLDEQNLKQIATDLGIDYIHMSKQNDINYKLKDIKNQISKSQSTEEKTKSYQDIYYYFSIPLVILLIINFIIQKRRI